MKKIAQLFLLFTFTNCIVINTIMTPLKIKYGHEKGSVASQRIMDAAIGTDLVWYAKIQGEANVGLLTLFTTNLIGLHPNEYYSTKEVDECIAKIQGVTGVIFSAGFSAMFQCKLEPDKKFWDPGEFNPQL